ncbi:MAG TPA: SRPBCC family protein [Gemmatimonadaceae bacterium]
MREFSTTIEIAAPTDRVWQVMRDVERWKEWTSTVTSVRLFGKPLRVGSRALIKQPKFPPAMWRVTHLDEGREFTWVSGIPGVMHVTARHAVEPGPRGSRATLSLRFRGGLGPWFGGKTARINQEYIETEARGLRARSE